MNVVNLPPGGASERFAQGRTDMFKVEPDEMGVRAMERALGFHREPQPEIDYSGVTLTDEQAALVAAARAKRPDMPDTQAAIHTEAAEAAAWRLGHLGSDLELPPEETLDLRMAA